MKKVILLLAILCVFVSGCTARYEQKESVDSGTPAAVIDATQEDVKFSNVLNRSSSYEEVKKHIPFHEIPDFPHTEKIWHQKLPVDYSERYPYLIPITQKESIVYYLLNHRIVGDGYNIWPENQDNKIYNTVIAFDLKTNTTQWIYPNEYILFHSIDASENFVFTGTNVTDKAIGQDMNYLIAIDIATGKEAWTFNLKQNVPQEILQAKGELSSLSIKGGIKYWNQQVFCIVDVYVSSMEKDEEGRYKHFDYYYLLSLNEKDGSVNWYHMFPQGIHFDYSYMIQMHNDILYISSGDSHGASKELLYTVDLNKKQVKDSYNLPISDLAFLSDEVFFLSPDRKNLTGLIDVETGNVPWTIGLFPMQKNVYLSFNQMHVWEDLIILHNDSAMCGIDTKKQDIQFVYGFEFDGLIENQESYMMHSFVQSDSMLYIGIGPQDYDQGVTYLVAFDISTQQFIWKWKIPETPVTEPNHYEGSIYLTMAPNLVDGSLFFITNRGKMYEIPVE